MKRILTLLTGILAINSNALANAEQDKAVLEPINNMFDAMREHDGGKLLAQFTRTALLERAKKDNSIQVTDIVQFAAFVSKTPKHLDEKLFNITIRQSGNLASAWTPFAFYLDGNLSHCGVNSFQLVKQLNQWKIQHLIDNEYVGDCETFIKREKAKAASQ